MTTITAFDYKATEAIPALAKGFVEAVKNDDAETAGYLYQVLYARIFRAQTGGFWRPEGHPHSDGTPMADQDIHYIIGLTIQEAKNN